MTNGFVLNHDKTLHIYFFCLKRRAKNDFLKDVESTVGADLTLLTPITMMPIRTMTPESDPYVTPAC